MVGKWTSPESDELPLGAIYLFILSREWGIKSELDKIIEEDQRTKHDDSDQSP